MRLQDNAAFAPLRCVLAGFFKAPPMRRPDLCLPGLSAVPCIWNFRMAEAQMTAFNLRSLSVGTG